jgi:hypothetical protein
MGDPETAVASTRKAREYCMVAASDDLNTREAVALRCRYTVENAQERMLRLGKQRIIPLLVGFLCWK